MVSESAGLDEGPFSAEKCLRGRETLISIWASVKSNLFPDTSGRLSGSPPCHPESLGSSIVVWEGAGPCLSGPRYHPSSLGSVSKLPGLGGQPAGQGAWGWICQPEPASQRAGDSARRGLGSPAYRALYSLPTTAPPGAAPIPLPTPGGSERARDLFKAKQQISSPGSCKSWDCRVVSLVHPRAHPQGARYGSEESTASWGLDKSAGLYEVCRAGGPGGALPSLSLRQSEKLLD